MKRPGAVSADPAFLGRDPTFLQRLADAPAVSPAKPPPTAGLNLAHVVEDPPERTSVPLKENKPWLSRKGRRINFAERDAADRRLGKMGEEFTVWFERQRLRAVGRDDLAGKVEWVSQTVGDGLGFDVLSFEERDGSERLIEVKTTGLGKYFPFYVTATEVRCSEDMGERFRLVRLFDFGRSPRLYVLTGSLRQTCQLEPALFRATR